MSRATADVCCSRVVVDVEEVAFWRVWTTKNDVNSWALITDVSAMREGG